MASSTFSLFFPLPTKNQSWPAPAPAMEESSPYDDHSTVTTSPSSSSSSSGSVDCTLSLGTPSSRRAAVPPVANHGGATPAAAAAAHYSSMSVAWNASAESYYCHQGKPAAGAAVAVGHDALLDRRCANCGTASTPLWRNGPRGPKSLCNACGIRYKKEERRAAATTDGAVAAGYGFTAQRARSTPGAKAATCGEEAAPYAAAAGEVVADAAPFLAWRLNVVPPAAATAAAAFSVWPERGSFYHYN
uniref:GATA-type domain-containing protein n=1 Tax=Leersia perrieri TaxID=77586 RepID=A0A0D9WK51_9ORYZ